MATEPDRVTIAVQRDLHKALIEAKPYGETVRDWTDYVVAEGLHAVEAQREEEE